METLKKVYIKSEADLPKIEGRYFVGVKNIEEPQDVFWWLSKSDAQSQSEYWLNTFDWYLLPEPVSNGNADLVQYVTNLLYAAYDGGKESLGYYSLDDSERNKWVAEKMLKFDQWVEEQTGLLSEFASQSHNEVTLPSDEDLEREFPDNLRSLAKQLHIPEDLMSAEMGDALRGIQEGNLNKQIGAKWLREQIKSQIKG